MQIQSAAQARQLFALERRGAFPRGETRRLLHAQGGMRLLPEYVGTAPVLLEAPVSYTNHPPGMPHVRSTVSKMAELARKGASSYPIVNLARRIVAAAGVPSKDYKGELAALYKWVRANIAYRKDPVHVEWLQAPARTVQERAGDCDDHTILLAALAGALGHRYHFDTVGPSPTVQKHVAAVVDLDGGESVVLDPVLEPAGQPGARADLGTFGLRAVGSHILWDSGGNMLGSVVNRRGARLWDWNPYYPPLGPGLRTGMQPAQGGVPAQPANAYRINRAPYNRGNLGGPAAGCVVRHVIICPDGSQQLMLEGPLGFSFIKLIKGVGKVAGKVVHVVGKLARSPIVQAGANAVIPGSGAAVAQAGMIEASAEHMIAKRDKGSAWQLPHPAIAKQYPSNASQIFDAQHQVFRVYVPQSGMSGIRPSLSFSLGAASSSSAQAAVNAVRVYVASHKGASPTSAIAVVRTFQQQDASTGRWLGTQPQMLTADGLWGPNTRKAAAWYLGVNESTLPPVAPALTRTHTGAPVPITWAPPTKSTVPVHAAPKAPVRQPPPAPPGTPVVPPAPIPGMIEVGHEANNPGLAPVAPSPAAAAAAPPATRTAAQKAATAAKRGTSAPAAAPVLVATSAPSTTGRTAAQRAATAAKKRGAAPVVLGPAAPVVVTPVDVTGRGGPAVPMPPAILTTGPGIPGGMTTAEYAQQAQPGGMRSSEDKTLMWLAIAYLWSRQNKRRQAA